MISGPHFVFAAGHPLGATNGVVGSWRSLMRWRTFDQSGGVIDEAGGEQELTLAADGTGEMLVTPTDGSTALEFVGTWDAYNGTWADYMFTGSVASSNIVAHLAFGVVDGIALSGDYRYERAD